MTAIRTGLFATLLLASTTALAPPALASPALAAPDLAQHAKPGDMTEARAEMMGEAVDSELAQALEARVTSGKVDKAVQKEFAPGVARAVRHAYASRLFKPVWTEAGARDFVDGSRDLFRHGVAAKDVFDNDLDKLVETRFNSRSAKKRAKADVKLTLAALRAGQAVSGTLADEGGRDMDADAPKRTVLTDFIVASGQGGFADELNALAPSHPQYAKLQEAMQRYRQLKAEGGWLAIPEGDLIEEGDTDARVSAIRARLAKEGFDAPSPSNPDLFDTATADALKSFQRRHGLSDDAVVGGNTLEALNESVESKIARIAETMHRWREHGDLGDRYVLANIPSYTAEGWNNGAREIAMRTVVGKPQHATPVFSDRAEYIVVNPKWYVPKSIARRQKLSKLQRDASYAPRKNYEVVDISSGQAVSSASVDWNDPNALDEYRLVQQPGPSNALGQMKIIFPNQYSVYLHDTPSVSLFEDAQRAFSSGCVRLERPMDMARWIAEGDSEMSAKGFTEQLESGERERMYLGEQIPVHITYHTVVVNDAGEPVFHRDVYDRFDEIEMVEKLAKLGPAPSVEGAP